MLNSHSAIILNQEKPDNKKQIQVEKPQEKGCLSCGVTENMGNRKYCSLYCRQRLRHMLNIRTGLLKALHTRYATFYFTDMLIIMDVLPYGSPKIFSFIYPRAQGEKPAKDFSKLADILGSAWWTEKNRTHKRYLASRYLFEQASRNSSVTDSINPLEIKIPTIKDTSLLHLKLGRADLKSSELQKIIKSAYRAQAKKHHPDIGGDTTTFRKIYKAYEELIDWAESPTFLKRRGFPDKWFYHGEKNRWVQPTPVQKKEC